MIREHVLTISTLLALVAVSGAAHAGPRITDKNYWLNEIGPSRRGCARHKGCRCDVSNELPAGGMLDGGGNAHLDASEEPPRTRRGPRRYP
jgi:hypothetical protein